MNKQQPPSKSSNTKLPDGFQNSLTRFQFLEALREYIWSLDDADKIRELTNANRFLNTPPDEKDGFPPTKKG